MNDLRAALVVAPALAALPARADERPFDWDRYHARQDACLEANRIAAACPALATSNTATSFPSRNQLISLLPRGESGAAAIAQRLGMSTR
jgi:hypothetical protein